jgi:signal transduction histidine kinase/CheY-like chemotaxis protein
MLKYFKKRIAKQDTGTQLTEISAEGRVRLLDMAYARLRFGFAMMPLIAAIFAWYYNFESHSASDYRVIIWAVIYFFGFVMSIFLHHAYLEEQKHLTAEDFLKKWLPRIHLVTIIHGLAIAILLPLVKDTVSIEYKYLYLAFMAAIVSGNASHQAPMLSVFHRFLATSWILPTLLLPWTASSHWQFILPLAIMYTVGMYRYSLTAHRFFVKMIWLEEESARLATSYKSAKDAAETALKDKNQFLTTASHDLRQPVHAMGFLIESISHRNKDNNLIPALKDLKQSVRLVTQMFNSLLDLSKIESGFVELKIGKVYLDTLFQEIATVFSEEARTKNLKIRTRVVGSNAIALVDGILLRQSIMNLMQNALRYTKKGGVLIAARRRGDDWLVEVWDTGIGVALEEQELIYSPFYRNEHAWRIDSAGHGLGLSVVARCCALMGCPYGFTSNLNKGSRFWMRLPGVKGDLQQIRIVNDTKQFSNSAARTSLSGSCLIVDDDPHVINAWQLLLSSWGVDTQCVESGKQALRILESGFMPKVILCDQRLRAGESGFEVLQALLKRCPDTHGAMISGEFNSPDLLAAENEGYLVLHKPLEPETLYTLLSRWLNSE